ncbi:Protein of unknown function [Alteromonadaceae bacterium Bs31]|nr:Protein of unknown function [Alteromonadaceae bacterium Bs31]
MKKNSLEKPFREKYSGYIILTLFALLVAFLISQRLFALPLCAFVIWFGYDIWLVNYQGLVRARSVKHWPKTPALLTQCEVRNAVRRNGMATPNWYLELEYLYEADDDTYSGCNYNWIGAVGRKPKIEKIAEQLNREISIFYQPGNPGQSVVIAYVSPIYFLGMLMGLALSLGGVTGILEFLGVINLVK